MEIWTPRLLDICPEVMFSSAAGYKAETDSLLFLVVRAGAPTNVRENACLVLLAATLVLIAFMKRAHC